MTETAPPPPAAGDARDGRALALAEAALVPLASGHPSRCPRCGEKLVASDAEPCLRCRMPPRSAGAARELTAAGLFPTEIARGALYLPRGALKILTTPRLWKHALIPLVINVILVVVVTWTVHHLVGPWLQVHQTDDAYPGWSGWWWGSLKFVAEWTAWIADKASLLFLPIITAWLLTGIFSGLMNTLFAPFMNILSRETETAYLGTEPPASKLDLASLQAEIAISVVDMLCLWALKLAVMVVTIPIAFVPIVGTTIWFFLPPMMQALDFTDFMLVRKGYATREKVAVWRARFFRVLGFGIAVGFFITLPFVNWIVVPSAAVGGTLLFLELDRK